MACLFFQESFPKLTQPHSVHGLVFSRVVGTWAEEWALGPLKNIDLRNFDLVF